MKVLQSHNFVDMGRRMGSLSFHISSSSSSILSTLTDSTRSSPLPTLFLTAYFADLVRSPRSLSWNRLEEMKRTSEEKERKCVCTRKEDFHVRFFLSRKSILRLVLLLLFPHWLEFPSPQVLDIIHYLNSHENNNIFLSLEKHILPSQFQFDFPFLTRSGIREKLSCPSVMHDTRCPMIKNNGC